MTDAAHRTQVIVTMRSGFAERYAAQRSLLDANALLSGIRSAELIGDPGYSMRISVAQREFAKLAQRLESDFVVEPDHVLETFSSKKPQPARDKPKALRTLGSGIGRLTKKAIGRRASAARS